MVVLFDAKEPIARGGKERALDRGRVGGPGGEHSRECGGAGRGGGVVDPRCCFLFCFWWWLQMVLPLVASFFSTQISPVSSFFGHLFFFFPSLFFRMDRRRKAYAGGRKGKEETKKWVTQKHDPPSLFLGSNRIQAGWAGRPLLCPVINFPVCSPVEEEGEGGREGNLLRAQSRYILSSRISPRQSRKSAFFLQPDPRTSLATSLDARSCALSPCPFSPISLSPPNGRINSACQELVRDPKSASLPRSNLLKLKGIVLWASFPSGQAGPCHCSKQETRGDFIFCCYESSEEKLDVLSDGRWLNRSNPKCSLEKWRAKRGQQQLLR